MTSTIAARKSSPRLADGATGIVLLAIFLVGGWGCQATRPPAPPDLVVESVEVLPNFTTNALVYGRDAGNSIRMGSEILWVFGDTFAWNGMSCATAAWSPAGEPSQLREPVDNFFASFPFYEFTPAEGAYNDSRDPPLCCGLREGCDGLDLYCWCPADTDCTTRIALWPGDLLATDGEYAFHVYEKVRIGSAPYDFEHLGTGVAVVRRGETVARRVPGADGEPLLLFEPDEPNFLRAIEVEEKGGIFVYLFAVTNRQECTVDIMLARVELASMLERDAYQFWNGSGWTGSLDDAEPILRQIAGGLGSVTWNDHLGGYLSAFNDVCTPGNVLVLRTAPRPEGPWSEPVLVDLSPFGSGDGIYAGQIHGSVSGDQAPYFTYYQPVEQGIGSLRIGRLRLR